MRVFVNCAPADRALAEQISHALSGAGYQVWFDGDISGAEHWWQRCTLAVRDADVFLTVWTPNLAAARPATALLQHAGALGRPVLAVRSGQVDQPPAGFTPTVKILEFGDGALASTVQAVAQQTGPWPGTQAPPPPWPFAYLTSLSEFAATPGLPAHEQQQLVARLQAASSEDGQYPAVRDGVTAVADRLRARPDLDPALRQQLDAWAPRPEHAAPQQYWSPAPQGFPPPDYAPHGYAPQGFPGYPPQGYPGYPPPPARSTSGRTLGIIGAVAVIVIIAVVAGIVLLTRSDDRPADSSSASDTTTSDPDPDTDEPVVRLVDDGILVGSRVAPVTIDVFNDALCPACSRFIGTYGEDIRTAVLDNEIRVHYHLINMLDDYSASGDYSSRAAAAVYCVAADADVDTFEDFYAALFDPIFQPEEGGISDHTDRELADLATEAGALDSAADCITTGSDASAAARRTAQAMNSLEDVGGSGVPVVFDDGVEVDLQPGWVDELIR